MNLKFYKYIINDNDKFIILASDDLWEFISNEDVRDIVNKYYKDFNLKDAIKDLLILLEKI